VTTIRHVCARALTIALLLAGSVRAAEHDWPPPPPSLAKPPAPRVSMSLTERAGIAEAPFVTTAFPEVSGFASVLTPSAALHLSSIGWLRARLPITYARVDFPAGAQVGEAALGNLELAVDHAFELRPSTHLGLVGALLAPTASHGPETSLLNNRALALGSALSGGKDAFLLTPGTTGLRLAASIEHTYRSFQFRAGLQLPLLLRISDASLPAATATKAIGLAPALDLEAAWWVTRWFGASLGAAVIIEALRVQEPARAGDRRRRLQPLLEPSLYFPLGSRIRLALDATIPVGGALGGNAWSIGPSARFEL
jgi:hypothetical protein